MHAIVTDQFICVAVHNVRIACRRLRLQGWLSRALSNPLYAAELERVLSSAGRLLWLEAVLPFSWRM